MAEVKTAMLGLPDALLHDVLEARVLVLVHLPSGNAQAVVFRECVSPGRCFLQPLFLRNWRLGTHVSKLPVLGLPRTLRTCEWQSIKRFGLLPGQKARRVFAHVVVYELVYCCDKRPALRRIADITFQRAVEPAICLMLMRKWRGLRILQLTRVV